MKKIECNLESYPNSLLCEGGLAKRYYTLLPLPHETEFLKKCRIDNACHEFSTNTLIISVFIDSEGYCYFAFGCTFLDKRSENKRVFDKDRAMLDYVNKLAFNMYNKQGLWFKRIYYLENACFLINKLTNKV